jgi:cellulose 1,4-beta-cellobiosidase
MLPLIFTFSETVSAPDTPQGPNNGLTGAIYTYVTDGAISNTGHPVQYSFDWDDGTNSGWLPMGTTSAKKSWTSLGTYNVSAQARCTNHTSILSSWSEPLPVTINSPPSSPTNVQASDGAYTDKVQVTWTASSWATSYIVYRATSTLRRATKVAIAITSNTTYDDTTASVGRSYYYWVKASNSYGTSGFSAYNKGYRSDGRPPAPANVQASDGAYTDKVQVTWTASSWATSYTVYRANSPLRWANKVAIGTTPSTTYDDKTALVGRTYYYWVKASNSYGTSGFSAYNKGYR